MLKTKKHTSYILADGSKVTSVTQAIGILDKPGLAPKANELGFLKINSREHWNGLAKIGTIAHHLVLCHLTNEKADTSEYKREQVDSAENSFLSYLEWEKGHKIEPVLLETPLVSETHRFGFTADIVCHLDGQSWLTLVDLKTGTIRNKKTGEFYPEAYYQASGYKLGLYEHGYPIKDVLILGIPRSADESFDEEHITSFDAGIDIFLQCLKLHDSIRALKKGLKGEA